MITICNLLKTWNYNDRRIFLRTPMFRYQRLIQFHVYFFKTWYYSFQYSPNVSINRIRIRQLQCLQTSILSKATTKKRPHYPSLVVSGRAVPVRRVPLPALTLPPSLCRSYSSFRYDKRDYVIGAMCLPRPPLRGV